MKKTTIPKWVIQWLVFNIVIFILFIFLWINYFLPEYNIIEDKKNELNNLQSENKRLLAKWLGFSEFKKKSIKDPNISDYLKNILSDPTKDIANTYKSNLVNNWSWTYQKFIEEKNNKIKEKEKNLENSKIKEKIKKILPSYKSDSNLKDEWLTDFEFVNYMEKIIHNFWLKYEGNIWIWNLTLEDSNSNKNKKIKKGKEDNDDWKIYSFKSNFNINWPKKNIIDFIYYLENVWSIYSVNDGKDIKINEVNRSRKFEDENWNMIKNDFYYLPRYFSWEKGIFNHIFVDIDSIWLWDYLDSSADPISYDEWTSFIEFIKTDQANEKYKINIVLKFYVKWLEEFKTKEYIKKVVLEYEKIQKIVSSWINIWKNNKSKLLDKWESSLKELEKINSYLKFISDDIKNLSDTEKLKLELWNTYKEAQKYQINFDKIYKTFDANFINISETEYKKYKDNLEKEKK